MLLNNFIKYVVVIIVLFLFTSCVGSISGLGIYKLGSPPLCENPPDTCARVSVVDAISKIPVKSVYYSEWPPDTLFYEISEIPTGIYNVVVDKYNPDAPENLGFLESFITVGKYLNPADSSQLGIISIGIFNLNHDEINFLIE